MILFLVIPMVIAHAESSALGGHRIACTDTDDSFYCFNKQQAGPSKYNNLTNQYDDAISGQWQW